MSTVETKEKPAKTKSNIFGKEKKADVIIFRLIKMNERLRDDTPLYPPSKRFPNTDIIVDGDGTRAIRYLPGFKSIYVDEQEAGGREIADNIVNNPNNRFEIINGEIKVKPHEKTKLEFLRICNRNVNSEHRTGTVEALFEEYNEDAKTENLSKKQSRQREAIEKAYKAEDWQIAFHSEYLGIPLIDAATSANRTFEAVKADYIQKAIDQPDDFLKTYDDQDLKDKYYIKKALAENIISTKLIPGKTAWTSSKEEICEIPAGSSDIEALFIYSKTAKGEAMMKKLKDL